MPTLLTPSPGLRFRLSSIKNYAPSRWRVSEKVTEVIELIGKLHQLGLLALMGSMFDLLHLSKERVTFLFREEDGTHRTSADKDLSSVTSATTFRTTDPNSFSISSNVVSVSSTVLGV